MSYASYTIDAMDYSSEIEEGWHVHMSHTFCIGNVFWMVIRSNHVSIDNSLKA